MNSFAETAHRAWREVKKIVASGEVQLHFFDLPTVGETAEIVIRINTKHGPWAAAIPMTPRDMAYYTDEGLIYWAAAQGERIRMQIADKLVGVLADRK